MKFSLVKPDIRILLLYTARLVVCVLVLRFRYGELVLSNVKWEPQAVLPRLHHDNVFNHMLLLYHVPVVLLTVIHMRGQHMTCGGCGCGICM